jgi:hypothetical protein
MKPTSMELPAKKLCNNHITSQIRVLASNKRAKLSLSYKNYTRRVCMILSFHILVVVGSEHAVPILINHPTQHD